MFMHLFFVLICFPFLLLDHIGYLHLYRKMWRGKCYIIVLCPDGTMNLGIQYRSWYCRMRAFLLFHSFSDSAVNLFFTKLRLFWEQTDKCSQVLRCFLFPIIRPVKQQVYSLCFSPRIACTAFTEYSSCLKYIWQIYNIFSPSF